MSISIRLAKIEDKETIFSLLQPYLKELSLYANEEVDCPDERGVYRYRYLDAYWLERGRYPYLLMSNRKIAGFALVRQEGSHWEMAEFYVLPEFRRRGIALSSASQVLKNHFGEWRMEFNNNNKAGSALWHKLAKNSSKTDIRSGTASIGHDYVSFSC